MGFSLAVVKFSLRSSAVPIRLALVLRNQATEKGEIGTSIALANGKDEITKRATEKKRIGNRVFLFIFQFEKYLSFLRRIH